METTAQETEEFLIAQLKNPHLSEREIQRIELKLEVIRRAQG
jgi:hypothetical protein